MTNRSYPELTALHQNRAATAGVLNAARGSVQRTLGLEGTGRNPTSTAVGTGQILEGTWADLLQQYRPDLLQGLTGQQLYRLPRSDPRRVAVMGLRVSNPALAREMTTRYAEGAAQTLARAGLPVNDETIYLLHHFGYAGGLPVVRAALQNPNTPMSALVPAHVMAANPYLRNKTAGQMVDNHRRRAGELPSGQAGQRPAPPSQPQAVPPPQDPVLNSVLAGAPQARPEPVSAWGSATIPTSVPVAPSTPVEVPSGSGYQLSYVPSWLRSAGLGGADG